MKKLLSALFAFAFLIITPRFAHAAGLYFAPSSGDYAQNENFTVSVFVDVEKSINAVSGMVTFPTEYLEVIAVSTANSVVNLWVQNPSFSNAGNTGNVHFEGIILNPGYIGSRGRIVDIVFGVKKAGSASLTFGESSILANDGEGSNILSSVGSSTFAFVKPQSSITTPKETNSPTLVALEKKLEEIENDIKNIIESSQKAPVIVVQKQELSGGVYWIWEVLPNWVKASALLAMGIATIILLFVLISLGVIILIWLWGQVRYNGMRIVRLLMNWSTGIFKKFFAYLGMAKKEVEGDIAYSIHEIGEEFQSAEQAPTLKELLIDYLFVLGRIIKRFFTKNENDILQENDKK